ncbi:hypothetical protein [Methylotuvimicrobium buryatense]|uniref:hypothetical protein n=1 Tax=Methylotuvimicrobium buryatense TaxID=95641 RepID=UPI0015863953|nr:hypothetical protein [Methylotuvimicrobium buryatense]
MVDVNAYSLEIFNAYKIKRLMTSNNPAKVAKLADLAGESIWVPSKVSDYDFC